MNIHKCLSSAALLCMASVMVAQTNVTGRVTDAGGAPMAGVAVSVEGTTTSTITDQEGRYSISAPDEGKLNFAFIGYQQQAAELGNGEVVDVVLTPEPTPFSNVMVRGALAHDQSLAESVASTSVVSAEAIGHRTEKNIGNNLFGHGLGLTALQNQGHYADYAPTFYVRGLKTLTGFSSSPLVMVDGIERDITDVTSYEIESVTVLKDAAAVALYGYKGVNGAINITTKHGAYEQQHVDVTYQWSLDKQLRRPEFVDAATYARAYNEAMTNDGNSTVYYTPEAITAFEKGTAPELFPNVDWQDEVLKDNGFTNNVNVTFHGGSKKFRYYTMLNLNGNHGFNKCGEDNPDYKTQDQYSRGSIRSNIDLDLTSTTKLNLNILASLSEARRTGSSFAWGSNMASYSYIGVWNALYATPASAFPVKAGKYWGGGVSSNYVLNGTYNPVAISTDAGYLRNHDRGIYVDFNLEQDLSFFVEGLGARFRLAYDNKAQYLDNYSRVYDYAYYNVNGGRAVTFDEAGNVTSALPSLTVSADGDGNSISTSLSTDAYVWNYNRDVKLFGTVFYDKQLTDNQKLYAQVQYDFEKQDSRGVDVTYYMQNISGYAHYVLNDRYIADVALVGAAHNYLAPGKKWNFSPTVALGWIASNEDFLKGSDAVDFLKLRASFGKINSFNMPYHGYWVQTYTGGPSYVMIDKAYTNGSVTTMPGAMIADDQTCEKAFKYNAALEARLFGQLDLVFEAFMEKRKDIWVDASGKYSDVFGLTAPWENGGEVTSKGFELGLEWNRKFGEVSFNLGGNVTYNTSVIDEQYEEVKVCDNLVSTGKRVGQVFGMKSMGFFHNQEEIDAAPAQMFTTVRPGDIRYEDVNGDGIVDANDKSAIGYNTICPELYYSFHIGAEWKGLGVDVQFQGAGRYSASLTTQGVYNPLVGNVNISEEYYNNRWTPETADAAKYPRLSLLSNANNNATNDVFIQDRNFLKLRNVEVYYNFPAQMFKGQKAVKGAKVFVRGRDLACFDSIETLDPEGLAVNYPLTGSFTAGLTVNF